MKKRQLATAVMAVVFAVAALAACSGSSSGSATEAATEAAAEAAAEAATEAAAEEAAEEATEAAAEETTEAAAEAEPAVEGDILVAAAASLKNAYEEELIPMFQELYPGVTVTGTYDSSGKLQTQIEEGLEADVFMSAATKQMTALDEEGLIKSDTIVNLLENKIVLIVPSGVDSALDSFESIVDADSIALGDPESVPVGQYSEESLTNLGIWDTIQDKVSFGTNVTEVLNQVAAASADAGIVYATDAASMPDDVVVVAEAPEGSLATPVIYPVAVVEGSANEDAAKAFVDFLCSDEAMAVFESYGFSRGE